MSIDIRSNLAQGAQVENGANAASSSREKVIVDKPISGEKSGVNKRALRFRRVFSKSGVHPFDEFSWTHREALISNERGEVVFRQADVEVPEFWSQMATNVVVSKYFRGGLDTPEREHSVRQLITRVADTIANWGLKDNYFLSKEDAMLFRDELIGLLVNQYGAFNSPVWFNVGIHEHPQCSACFILSVDDSMESLLDLQKAEAMLFKFGSGAGSNLSNIRSSKESLSGGGIPSGPVSFMRAYDAWAGTIKSGGKTRRAAKMQILDIDHPDIKSFVNAKRTEEEKAWALIEEGYNGGFNVPGGAYDSVYFQNANLSVRVSDDFMHALNKGKKFATKRRTDGKVCEEIDPKELMMDIAKGTWVCGDPGLQFDTIINNWHTCSNSGRINASNPCSEYMHLDDSACNLASINLLKFLDESGNFDIEGFKHAVDIFITAQEIIVGNASYPTERIGANAIKFRQLGLGFANLGALLMCLGVAYDSDEGRAWAAAIMAMLTGEAYLMSSKIAECKGPFDGYAENKGPMLSVMGMHKEAADNLPRFLNIDPLVDEAQSIWRDVLRGGKQHGFRNSQATVLAPTGTIAFLMDCDTTGIEPDIALVKYKRLVGGGMLKIVNQSVSRGLRKLGYREEDIQQIIAHIDENDTIEGSPGLKNDHLPVFDCAFKAAKGSRYINYMGHVKMMAATQPFVSGAISKTVNMPEQSTVEEIFQTYVEAWKMGLKAIAIYRDNSKRSQPLATSKHKETDVVPEKEQVEHKVERRHLPDERQAITHKFNIAGHEGYITVGLYDDGNPGEIFIVMAKEGSTLSGVMDAFATSISLALQYGVPLSALVKKFAHMRFEPSGFTASQDIPHAKSLLDYIFRWMGLRFLSPEEQAGAGIFPGNASAGDNGGHVRAIGDKGQVDDVDLDSDMENKTSEVTSKLVHRNESKQASVLKLVAYKTNGSAHGSTQSASLNHKSLPYVLDDAPPCTTCGSSMMVRQGACYRCLNCGSQGGCG